jgi:hypothetical protein
MITSLPKVLATVLAAKSCPHPAQALWPGLIIFLLAKASFFFWVFVMGIN